MNKLERLKDRLKKIKGALPELDYLLFIISRILLVLIFMFTYVIMIRHRLFGFPIAIVCFIIFVLIHLLYGIKGQLDESVICFSFAVLIVAFFEEDISNIVLRIIELIK